MRRNAPTTYLLAVISACGGSQSGTDPIVLDTGEPASTGEPPAGSTGDTTTATTGDASTDDAASTDADDTSTSSDPTTPSLCGNGVLDDGEDCDGGAAQACDGLGADYTWGDAACTADCRFDTTTCQTCEAPEIVPCDPQSEDPFHAIELGCADLDGWSDINSVPLLSRTFASEDDTATRVLRQYGLHLLPGDVPAWAPRAGERMLLLGNGSFGLLDVLGVLLMPPGAAKGGTENANPEADGALPAPMVINMNAGSLSDTPFVDCDGAGDCSQTLRFQWLSSPHAGDIAYLDVEVKVPTGTRGYALDLALFTAHYPEYTATAYNDMAIVWSDSEAYTGNIAYLLVDGQPRPFSLPALDAVGLMSHDGAVDLTLLGTGFDGLLGQHGGATDWLTLHGPAVPGETLTLALAVFDLEDTSLDSALLVDNFRWRCEPCTLGGPIAAGGCGLRPASR